MDRRSQKTTMILVLFGLPAAGKTYVGKLLQDEFCFFFYDGDKDLTSDMKRAIRDKIVFTDAMRDVFFVNLIQSVHKLYEKHKRLAIAQTFIKEKYRKQFLKEFPDVQFILVQTNTALRENRLTKRNDLSLAYTQKMVELFEEPTVKHFVLENNIEGKNELKKKINNTLSNLLL